MRNPSVIPARIWLLQCICRQPASHIYFYVPAECCVNCSDWQFGLNKQKAFFPGKRMLLKHWSIVLSLYGHYAFWVKLKLLFWALSLFKHCKISLPFVIEKDKLSVLFLNYTGFSSKHRRVRVLWGFIKNFILTYSKIFYVYKLNFSFFLWKPVS